MLGDLFGGRTMAGYAPEGGYQGLSGILGAAQDEYLRRATGGAYGGMGGGGGMGLGNGGSMAGGMNQVPTDVAQAFRPGGDYGNVDRFDSMESTSFRDPSQDAFPDVARPDLTSGGIEQGYWQDPSQSNIAKNIMRFAGVPGLGYAAKAYSMAANRHNTNRDNEIWGDIYGHYMGEDPSSRTSQDKATGDKYSTVPSDPEDFIDSLNARDTYGQNAEDLAAAKNHNAIQDYYDRYFGAAAADFTRPSWGGISGLWGLGGSGMQAGSSDLFKFADDHDGMAFGHGSRML